MIDLNGTQPGPVRWAGSGRLKLLVWSVVQGALLIVILVMFGIGYVVAVDRGDASQATAMMLVPLIVLGSLLIVAAVAVPSIVASHRRRRAFPELAARYPEAVVVLLISSKISRRPDAAQLPVDGRPARAAVIDGEMVRLFGFEAGKFRDADVFRSATGSVELSTVRYLSVPLNGVRLLVEDGTVGIGLAPDRLDRYAQPACADLEELAAVIRARL